MLVTIHQDADLERVKAGLQSLGLWTQPLEPTVGASRALLVADHSTRVAPEAILALEGVADVALPKSPHPAIDTLAGATVDVHGHAIGDGAPPVLMAGPCSVESPEQIHAAAAAVVKAGGRLLRGGAFKPRTSPYSFQGAGRPALGWMREAADAHGLGMVTEVMSERDVDDIADVADLLQVGSRNMQNYALLREVGRAGKPVLLKRGMAATVEEWLLAGEHVMSGGASGVVFCERGIQAFDTHTRNLLDLGAVALLAQVYRLPVVVDPSHATGRRDLVPALAAAALAAGAHGLLVESHPDPGAARSDGPQALPAPALIELGRNLARWSPPR